MLKLTTATDRNGHAFAGWVATTPAGTTSPAFRTRLAASAWLTTNA